MAEGGEEPAQSARLAGNAIGGSADGGFDRWCMNVPCRTTASTWPEYFARLALLAAAFYLISKGLAWAQGSGQFISPVWPACGVALAGMLIWGAGMWPAVYFPMVLSSLIAGDAVAFSVLAPTGLTATLCGAAWALERWKFDMRLATTRDVVLLAVVGAIVPMAAAGLWNAGVMVLSGMLPSAALFQTALVYGLANATGVMIVTPLIVLAVGKRYPRGDPGQWGILGLLLISVCFAFSGVVGQEAVLAYLPFPFLVWLSLVGGLPMAAIGILGAVLGAVGFSSYGVGPFAAGSPLTNFAQIELYIGIFATTGLLLGAGSETQRREKVLREQAATREAEMERIKAQIQPHFLFNCLAAIHSLAGTDSESARGGIIALSDLLRASLDSAGEKVVPLGQEIKMIENYLALQRMRFEDSLQARVDCSSEVAAFAVPPMVVQPLVENAIKHGVDEDGCVSVKVLAYEKKDGHCILVKNTVSANACDPEHWQDGVGLSSVRRRLEDAYSGRATLSISREDPNWIVVCIFIMKEGKE